MTKDAFDFGYDCGLERAALHLQRKADDIRKGGHTAEAAARMYEEEAEAILALRKGAKVVL